MILIFQIAFGVVFADVFKDLINVAYLFMEKYFSHLESKKEVRKFHSSDDVLIPLRNEISELAKQIKSDFTRNTALRYLNSYERSREDLEQCKVRVNQILAEEARSSKESR